MVRRLSPDEVFHASKNLRSRFPLINAVLYNKQTGTVFTDHNEEGIAFFIIHKSGFSYLQLPNDSGRSADFLNFMIESTDVPNYFHVYDPSESFIQSCLSHNSVNVRLRNRIQLRCNRQEYKKNSMQLPVGYNLQRITASHLPALASFQLSLEKRYWNSEIDFLHNGFGFIVVNESEEPVSICYSACVADKIAEIDIATLEEFQKRGLGRQTVHRFAEHCFDNDILPNWDCFEDNHASFKTATSVGFKPIYSYRLLSIFNKTK